MVKIQLDLTKKADLVVRVYAAKKNITKQEAINSIIEEFNTLGDKL